MTRGLCLALALLPLLACGSKGRSDDPYVAHCSAVLEASLRSPSTLKVAHSEHTSKGSHLVTLDYDAADPQGTPIRGKIECEYPANPYWTYHGKEKEPPWANSPIKASTLSAKKVTMGKDELDEATLADRNAEAAKKLRQEEAE